MTGRGVVVSLPQDNSRKIRRVLSLKIRAYVVRGRRHSEIRRCVVAVVTMTHNNLAANKLTIIPDYQVLLFYFLTEFMVSLPRDANLIN